MNSWLFLGLLGLAIVGTCYSQDICAAHADGCSIPYDLPYFYKTQFTPSCNQHDVCYACGSSKGISRKVCDDTFYHHLTATCARISRFITVSDVKTTFCNVVRTSYYTAVRFGGSSHFENSSPSWCHESWVSSCLP